jgi:hypothetical protein
MENNSSDSKKDTSVSIKTTHYTALPSDSREWIIIRSPEGLEIDCELKIMDYHYDCIPKKVKIGEKEVMCSELCCYCGCYIDPKEIGNTLRIMPKIRHLLRDDAQKLLEENGDQIIVPGDFDEIENLYKTCAAPKEWDHEPPNSNDEGEDEGESSANNSEEDEEVVVEISEDNSEDEDDEIQPPVNHCMFLMESGYCATHSYYVENKIDWVKEKFNICVTFPLDIRPQDKTLAFMDEFDQFFYTKTDCISSDEDLKISLGMPQIIESMKYAIVDRYGLEFWGALNAFAKDWREGKIDLEYLYQNLEEDK